MRLSLAICVVALLALREAMVSSSVLASIGCAATLVCCGGVSLCCCGLELLAFVVVATYVVVFLVLFVIVLGWRDSDIGVTSSGK